jgi:hypothetical protein
MLSGSRASADRVLERDHRGENRRSIRSHLEQGGGEISLKCLGPCTELRDRRGGHRPKRYGVDCSAIEVGAHHRVKMGGANLVEPERPMQRVAPKGRDQFGAPCDHTSLGAAEELVGAEGDQVCAVGQDLARCRFIPQPRRLPFRQPWGGGVGETRTDVVDHDQVLRTSDCRRSRGRHRSREPDLVEVRWVDLEDHGGVGTNGALDVFGMGFVGGANLPKPGTALRHDLRHPERASDLDELPARHDHLAT